MRSADLVILLLDITDSTMTLRIKLSEGIRLLREMEIPRDNILVVFNKIDLAPRLADTMEEELGMDRLGLPWTIVSAKERTNLDGLLRVVMDTLKEMNESPGQYEAEEKVEAVDEE